MKDLFPVTLTLKFLEEMLKKRPFITLCGFHAGLWPQHLPPGMTFFLIIISIGCMEYQSKKENDIF